MRLRVGSGSREPMRLPSGLEADCELALGVAEGDRDSFERLVDRHLAAVYKYVVRRLGQGPEQEKFAREVTVATWEDAMRRMKPYARRRTNIPMRLWLFRLANRQLAKRQARLKALLREASGESEEIAQLRRAFADIPLRQQAALSLALFEALPAGHIAGALGLNNWRAMSVLRRALRRVDARLLANDAES